MLISISSVNTFYIADERYKTPQQATDDDPEPVSEYLTSSSMLNI